MAKNAALNNHGLLPKPAKQTRIYSRDMVYSLAAVRRLKTGSSSLPARMWLERRDAEKADVAFKATNVPVISGKLIQCYWMVLFNRQLATCPCGGGMTAKHLLCGCRLMEVVETREDMAEVQGEITPKAAFLMCRDEPAIVWKILGRLAGMGMVEDLFMKETFVACTKHVDEVQFTRIDDRWQWDGESFDGDLEFDRSSLLSALRSSHGTDNALQSVTSTTSPFHTCSGNPFRTT
jgi:hypothetical protein